MASEIGKRLSDEQLRALEGLDAETIQRLGDVADKLDGRSRREILAMLGGAGVAAGGLAYGVGSATADPDGSPSVTGQQSDRTDVWADQIDANVVDVDQATLNGADGHSIGGDDIIGVPGTSNSVSLSFGTWRQADSSRPAIVILRISVFTDGTTEGRADIRVDEAGGTAPDYSMTVFADPSQNSGSQDVEHTFLVIPAGAQYKVDNTEDPNGSNAIQTSREMIL